MKETIIGTYYKDWNSVYLAWQKDKNKVLAEVEPNKSWLLMSKEQAKVAEVFDWSELKYQLNK